MLTGRAPGLAVDVLCKGPSFNPAAARSSLQMLHCAGDRPEFGLAVYAHLKACRLLLATRRAVHALLEPVAAKNVMNILIEDVLDASHPYHRLLLLGYAISYGDTFGRGTTPLHG